MHQLLECSITQVLKARVAMISAIIEPNLLGILAYQVVQKTLLFVAHYIHDTNFVGGYLLSLHLAFTF